ncbi:hypothetical protein ECZU51_63540 [Escherichia coli]|nr:hypothetical protein ECZU51_63540 [Escherichia coli]
MRKNNTAIIFGSLFFSCSVMAANGTLAPTVVPMVNGGQASIAISNTSPNLFTVPGDRIIAVNSLDGALTNNEQTASGGVVVATVNKKPFTFILETERGLNLSIQAVPREGAGRTIQLVSDLRGTGEEAGAWETSTPYESLLVTISRRPWRKITRRLVSGPGDKGNPAGPGGVFSGRCRMDGESPEDGPLCRGK